ncbi:MAG TPA: hypothetical protein VLB44_21035, partial [Kofleriaceae bacterium]|nr:hypothetical protein [Kofleriaceae bacterium]
MAARLPGPGPQVSTGRLRVDAGRAIKKLREYQLADRTAWILEAIRAAVASGATQISLSGDANDIWLAWEGEPWPLEVLPRLFDELVSPAAGSDVQHVRLLAAAVNSALGMDPAYVDVLRIDTDGTAQVARYTPDVLAETGDLEESPLQRVTAQPTEPPDGAKPGMVVHLRRRISLSVLAYFVGAPPELALAEQACRDIAVPLHVRGHVLHRKESQDVFRIPLGEGLDGFIAVSDRVVGEPQLEVAEHGVVLARYTLQLDDTDEDRAVPLRVFVDGPRMPTNASRSQVRRDKHPISTAEASAKKLVPDVITQLQRAVTSGDERARGAALAWIAAQIGGPHWHVEAPGLEGPLRELAKLPLVRNAVGEPRGLTTHWRSEIHTGRKPLPSELAAWLSDMLWIPPGDAALTLLQGAKVYTRAASVVVRWAKRQAAAQRKFYSHAKRDARVVAAKEPRVRARLGAEVPASCIDQERFANLTGEICVYAEGGGGSLVVLLEGRELERIAIPSSIAFDAVIDSTRAKPSERYRGVVRDGEYTRIERAMCAGVIRAIEAIAVADHIDGFELGSSAGKAADAQLVRSALALAREQGIKLRGPLTSAGAWVTTDERWVGLADLRAPAIGVTTPGRALIAPKDRIVLYANENERQLIGKLFSGRIIRYDRAQVVASPGSGELAIQLADGRPGALGIRDGDLVGAIAPSNKSTLQLQHMGVRLATRAYKARYIECAILVDSDAIIPDTDWKTALEDGGLGKRDYGAWELALIRALARALIGDRIPELRMWSRIELRGPLGLALCQAFLDGDPKEMLGPQIFAGFCAAPLLTLLGRNGPASIDDLLALYPAEGSSIPVVHGDAEPVPGFSPLLAPNLVGQAVAKLANRKWHEASGELARRQRRL